MTARFFVELFGFGVVFAAQLVIHRKIIAHARSRPPWVRKLALGGLWGVFLWCGLGLALTLPSSHRRIAEMGITRPAPAIAFISGTSYLWAFVVTGAVVAWTFTGRVAGRSLIRSRRRLLQSAAAAIPVVATGYGLFIERTNFRVAEIDLPVADLPPDLHGLRIAQLSDIHLSAFLSAKELARVVDAANAARPNVTVVTGDLISHLGDPLDVCLAEIGRLRADAGVYGCHGNHEIFARCEAYATREGARRGVRFLRRDAAALSFGGATLNVVGVDYQPSINRANYLAGTERLIIPGATNLLLSHNPDVFPVAAKKGFEAMLAGHTHGGQVTFEILQQSLNVARLVTPYVFGLYREGRASAYVTRGIGTIGVPVRLGATPELAVLRLVPALPA